MLTHQHYIKLARTYLEEIGEAGYEWCHEAEVVFTTWIKQDCNKMPDEKEIKKWLKKYFKGYLNRPSLRRSNPIGTIPDSLIDFILVERLPKVTNMDLEIIKYAHRLSMSAENILGQLLEEYLSIKLRPYGWYCCWGASIRAVDFCNERGQLLQVKNRSNTENSSSSAIRNNTEIIKWYRLNANNGQHKWMELEGITKIVGLNEDDFRDFVSWVVKSNKNMIFIEESYWSQFE